MGVLEDAIREHLDLKRRHGASDEELSRQEAEALGPTRREEPDAEHEPSADGVAQTGDGEDLAVEEAVVEAPVEPAAAVEPPVEPAPVEPAPPVLEEEEPPVEPELPEPEPPEAALPSEGPEAPPAPADQDTVMYEPGEVPVPPEEDSDPDFSSERPEQKQPRDFDFE
jgi:hypothetical protein